jgi:hypothetical protein
MLPFFVNSPNNTITIFDIINKTGIINKSNNYRNYTFVLRFAKIGFKKNNMKYLEQMETVLCETLQLLLGRAKRYIIETLKLNYYLRPSNIAGIQRGNKIITNPLSCS